MCAAKNTGIFSEEWIEKWKPYKRVGEPLPGTRMIVFKTPVEKSLLGNLLPKEDLFGIDDLFNEVESRGYTLGTIIDLTYKTNLYYDYKDVIGRGVEYVKIPISGQQSGAGQCSPPGDELVDKFFLAVDRFIDQNVENEKLIGVHCTQGINRSGYMVCRYMIDRMGMDPGDVIEAFTKARGHRIEAELYLEDLNPV
ncbi:RNA/RNP complex-1-interacting phosphatase-like [Saccoglossus kowalevskii]|uniref:RNA/RNP complex-1-interacting phosphatase-like n=1 Tax=Saccoglossus kowalevskii TaxID=10224 RepID=A0ABM0LW10_SACKO|nr:PREDICTED: RNA/RNP complex-1-interacting phosphatase-like [Saccoglossus kowalevskii]